MSLCCVQHPPIRVSICCICVSPHLSVAYMVTHTFFLTSVPPILPNHHHFLLQCYCFKILPLSRFHIFLICFSIIHQYFCVLAVMYLQLPYCVYKFLFCTSKEWSKVSKHEQLDPFPSCDANVIRGTLFNLITTDIILSSENNTSSPFSYLLLLGVVSEKKIHTTPEKILVKLPAVHLYFNSCLLQKF